MHGAACLDRTDKAAQVESEYRKQTEAEYPPAVPTRSKLHRHAVHRCETCDLQALTADHAQPRDLLRGYLYLSEARCHGLGCSQPVFAETCGNRRRTQSHLQW